MNREEFNKAYPAINPKLEDAAGALISFAERPTDLSDPPYTFVPVGDRLYEILCPGDRGDYFRMKTRDYSEFYVGTLEEAYQRVFDERRSMHERRMAAAAETREREENTGHNPE